MQRFLKTMASFLQKLFLTTSSGITFRSEVEERRGLHKFGFLRVFCGKQEKAGGRGWGGGAGGGGNCLQLPLSCRPWGPWCRSGSLKVLKTLFGVDNAFKEQKRECKVARQCFLSSGKWQDLFRTLLYTTRYTHPAAATALCIIPILSGNISVKL